MAESHVPFKKRCEEPIKQRTKTWTTRTKWLGNVGDTFTAFGRREVIVERREMLLADIARDHWREEGCTSEQDFIECWKEIHPQSGWTPNEIGGVHIFKDTGPAW